MNKSILFIFIFLISLSKSSSAQTNYGLKSGKLVFGISMLGDQMSDQQKAMMPTESIMYFKDDKSRVEISMSMGTTIIISDNKTKKTTVLMDFMGNKIAMETDQTETKKEMEKNGKYKVELLDGSKEIAGYKCKKAKITQTHDGKEFSFDVWYTKEISANNASSNGIDGIDGCMLEFEIFQNGMRMKMTTKSITSQDVDASKFIIPDGYTKTTAEGLKSLMGGGRAK